MPEYYGSSMTQREADKVEIDRMRTFNEKKLVHGSEEYQTQLLYFTCSSLSADDSRVYMIWDKGGSPNVVVKDLKTDEITQLTDNQNGYMKSYVYFDGPQGIGLSKASVCLDPERDMIYYIQDNVICCVGLDGKIRKLNVIPENQVTAFTHVSTDGTRLCVPTTDAEALDYDPDTQGEGLDKRPVYDIDGRVQERGLNSWLRVYDTRTGEQLLCERVPKGWVTHVQFHPTDHTKIMYNHEWSSFDCGIRRIWLFDGEHHRQIRTQGDGRSRNDWVCHEMWSDDGNYVIYHGAYDQGAAFVGRADMVNGTFSEIALPQDYDAYGHFTMNHAGDLVCDGYFKFPEEIKPVRENSTDNGPDPHKKDAEYVSVVKADWDKQELTWIPLCKHETDWLGQDAHPHAIYNHQGDQIYFSSRHTKKVKVYSVCATLKE